MASSESNAPLIVVIDDEIAIRRFLTASLTDEGYRVKEAENAREGKRLLLQESPAAVLLDLGLPDREGRELITEVRGWSNVPIIVLSARDQEREKVAALDAGADDYLSKPFHMGELLARLRAALRRSSGTSLSNDLRQQASCVAASFRMDLAARRVFCGNQEVHLTKIEYDLLSIMVKNAGKVLTHKYLLKEVWGPLNTQETHYLRVFVATLRKKIEVNPSRPQLILTEQGVGYRFADLDE
jgi:two-component system KDP operon response regulator KdpE